MVTKTTKFIPINMLLIVLALILSGCLNPIEIPKASPSAPTPTEITSSPSVTAVVPVMTTALPPYPTSAENFIKTPSISGAEARKIIVDKGAGEDLKALENWYKSKGIVGSGMSNFVVPVVYQEGGNFNWNLMIKKNNGNFLKLTITSGKEADQVVRAMGMITYLASKPSFKVSELADPVGMESVTQQVIWDRSGWSVIGAFQGSSLVAWFNADAPNGGGWVKLQEIVPTAEPTRTPEPTQENFSYRSSINPNRLAAVQASFYPGFDDHSIDLTDKLHYPLVGVVGYPVAYSLERDENGTQFFVLLATGGGLIKANINVFNFEQEPWPQTMHETSRIDDKEIKEISESIDDLIKRINEGDKFKNSWSYIILITINTKADSRACLINHKGLENAERLCAYDASKEALTPKVMLSKIEDLIISTKGKNPQDALNLESYPALSSEGNMYVQFQLQTP